MTIIHFPEFSSHRFCDPLRLLVFDSPWLKSFCCETKAVDTGCHVSVL